MRSALSIGMGEVISQFRCNVCGAECGEHRANRKAHVGMPCGAIHKEPMNENGKFVVCQGKLIGVKKPCG